MTFTALYLLPAAAIAIVLQGSLVTVRGNLMYRSWRFQQRTRARVFFFRCLVAALLLATIITKVWSPLFLPPLMQGLLFTIAMMIPVAIYVMIVRLQTHGGSKQGQEKQQDNETEAHAEQQQRTETTTAAAASADKTETGIRAAATSLHSQESSSSEEHSLDQTLSVGEQLETLDELVDFHDIGNEDYSSNSADRPDNLFNPLEKAIAIAREGILEEPAVQDYSKENLPARSSTELAEMVVRLRSDKMKLQKLVIAQKAVIDAEKQAHERTRVVVKDAISVMRHARHGQRIAEKIARRERAERQRLEKDFDKVKRQLDNALSTMVTGVKTETEDA